jgi:hypothetical protein
MNCPNCEEKDREISKLKKDLEMDVFTLEQHIKSGQEMAKELHRIRNEKEKMS